MVKQLNLMDLERIYIDANVLINYCTKQPNDYNELRKLFSADCKSELYTSNLAIVQVISKLQSKTRDRAAMNFDEISKYVRYFYNHCKVYEVNNNDIHRAMRIPYKHDLEDNIHYIASLNTNCKVILTNNKKDYVYFDVIVRTPRKVKPRKKI